jgi:hypothetical protein
VFSYKLEDSDKEKAKQSVVKESPLQIMFGKLVRHFGRYTKIKRVFMDARLGFSP